MDQCLLQSSLIPVKRWKTQPKEDWQKKWASRLIEKIFSFTYHAPVENHLIEHEYDHVFAGEYEGEIHPDKKEVSDFCYVEMGEIKEAMELRPHTFTSWFKIAFPKIGDWWKTRY